MSKYIKLEDAIRKYAEMIADEAYWEHGAGNGSPDEEDMDIAREYYSDLPTIEVSEEELKGCDKVDKRFSEDAVRCYGFLKERIGSEITDSAEEFEKWFERMVYHVRKCNEYDSELRTVSDIEKDGEDYLRGYNDGWYAHEVITNAKTNAKLHIDKPRGFTLKTEKGYGNYGEDAISRAWVLTELGNNRTMPTFLDFLSIVENAPSVVPSRAEGEWIDDPKNNEIKYCSNCELGYTKDFLLGMLPYYNPNPQIVEPPYCPNCGAKMKG